ncbi:SusC/RagA family TonB-linked outer membrane protein [Rubrolithibacter danxiaensis]|uniref:SusC/RagA family TonB-linked outer membrane protein n=1 Tax=Rubrolithibacter danxiaensis TaxID=3390805 RepID=UPI003BF867DD
MNKVLLRRVIKRVPLGALLLALILNVNYLYAQQPHVITGKVSDQQGLPLPGVSVAVKGTAVQSASDADGVYKISLPAAEGTLIFSYIGMKTREIEVKAGQATINVTLQSSSTDLQEVVVVGYGTTKKSDLTGSVASLKGNQLNRTPAGNVDQLLQGKIPGLQVVAPSGRPGAGVTVRIRGANSLNGDNSPLVVVDGFPWGSAGGLKQINPEDIESIEVLKDASSAAIYGSRGANGVIMITTRKGKAGQARINFSTLQTVSTLANKLDLWRNPVEEATISNEAAINGGTDPIYVGRVREGTYFPSIAELRGLDPDKPQWAYNTDWADLVLRNPVSHSYTLSADGGNENTKYSISGNYYNEEGLAIKNYFNKYNARLSLDQKLTKHITAGTNVLITHTKNNGLQLSDFVGRSRIFPAIDPVTGAYFRTGAQDFGNPVAWANEVLDATKTLDLMGSLYANIEITPWLQFRSQLSSKYGSSIYDRYDPRNITSTGNLFNGQGQINNWSNNQLINENWFTVTKSFGTDHSINAVAGYTTESNVIRTSNLTGRNFVNDNLQNEQLSGAVQQFVNNDLTRTALNSWLGRINYTFKNRYLFTLTGRADGSSKFGANNKWAFFPSGAFAWKVNEEGFLQSVKNISELKLRASYGVTGNQGIQPYQTLDRLGSSRYWNGSAFVTGYGPGLDLGKNQQGLSIFGGLANQSLKWETTRSLDLGFDLGLYNQRYTLTFDYYTKRTYDLLRERNINPSSGYGRQWVNDGTIDNKGVELGLNADILRGAVEWSVGGNIGVNRNKVVAMGELGQILDPYYIERVRQAVTSYTVGQPLYAMYGYKTDGIIQTEAEGLEAGLTGEMAQPGEIKYVDLNGDGVVDPNDRTIIGNPNPDFIYSFNTSLKYKRFDLAAQFYGVQGNDVFNLQKFSPSAQLQRWTPDNPSNEYPRVNSNRGYWASDWFIQDGSFLRIQNVTVGYNLKQGLIKGVKNVRLYFSGNNLYTFTKFPAGSDPEVSANGVFEGTYPKTRAFSLGLNVGF